MDNSNNNLENRQGNYSNPASEETVSVTQKHSQGQYPKPPEWTQNIIISEKPWISSGEEGNVSVQFNETEKSSFVTAESSDTKKELPMWVQIAIVSVIALITILLSVYIMKDRNPEDGVIPSMQTPSTTLSAAVTSAPTTVPTAAAVDDKTTTQKISEKTTDAKDKTTTVKNNEATSSAPSVGSKDKEKAKKQIVEYFNESSNRVKTEAVKVVKNFENRTHNAEKLSLPSAIKSVAKSVLESKITDITEPVEYPTREAIIAGYPAPGQEWSSCLDADDVEKAVCTEKGGEYEITLVLKDCVDPEPGKGISKAVACLDVPTVRDTAPPFITAFSAEYYDCVIRCRVEKETGRIVWSNYTAPVLIKVGLDAGFVAFDAEIGLTFEKDYSVTY